MSIKNINFNDIDLTKYKEEIAEINRQFNELINDKRIN